MRENRGRKNARAVVVILAAIPTKHLVVCAILVVVFEEVVGFGCPLDKLPPFEFIQLMTDSACVLRIRDEQEKDVMEQVVCDERPHNDRRRHQDYRHTVHELLP